MTFPCLMFLTLLFPLHFICAVHGSSSDDEVTSLDLRSWKGENGSPHEHRVRNVHGILNVIGWGILMPIGVIVARYFKKQPMFLNHWYPLHKLFQILGYLLGSIGWSIGITLLGNGSGSRYNFNTHRVLGIIIFSLSNLQVLAIWFQPKEEHKCRRYWEMYHRLLGYVLVALIIANIFQGLGKNDGKAEKWKWAYVAVLGVLTCISVSLETFRWIKSRSHRQMRMSLDNNRYNSS